MKNIRETGLSGNSPDRGTACPGSGLPVRRGVLRAFWNPLPLAGRLMVWVLVASAAASGKLVEGADARPAAPVVLLARQGAVAAPAQELPPGSRVETGPASQAAFRTGDDTVVRVAENSSVEISAPQGPIARFRVRVLQGIVNFFHRDEPTAIEIDMRSGPALVQGTEFTVETLEDGRTVVTVLDGAVKLVVEGSELVLTNGQQSISGGGAISPPQRIDAISVIQWALYYPGVIDVSELELSAEERASLQESLAAYRVGDLAAARMAYPKGRAPGSPSEKIYAAALALGSGQVRGAEELLDLPAASDREQRLALALRELIAAVRNLPFEGNPAPQLATEWLARSYYQQAQADLPAARASARQALGQSPEFGYGWARLAELEFSFGEIKPATKALARALDLSPRNAQAHALNGFLFAAKNQIAQAIAQFEKAIALDPFLANGWLGRGLCRIRQNRLTEGQRDLLVAAAMEPNRAFLRSYLGKAQALGGDQARAAHEMELAKTLDPRDPTAWLYSALLKQQQNRINEAIRDLETSQELTGNRAIYRSKFALDQDRAVRSANLAHIYRDADMTEWSVREAGKAVSADYANYSAHLFLANSYDELRDPNRINLRYETPAESEYLIANLLAPVGAGPLSQTISQGEYSKLFERDRLGVISSTEYLSRGAWTQNGAQFGTFGNSSYALEAKYRTDPGQRPNNDFEERNLSFQFKQQLTFQDTLLLQVSQYESEGGDRLQYVDQRQANTGLRTSQSLEPSIFLGYHRAWSPHHQSLFLASRLSDEYRARNPSQTTFLGARFDSALAEVLYVGASQDYQSDIDLTALEWQEIWQNPISTIIAGARWQTGDFEVSNLQYFAPGLQGVPESEFPVNLFAANQREASDFHRLSLYAYSYWQVADALLLVGGFAADWMTWPENFRAAPVSDGERSIDQLSPKAGLVWTPAERTTLRAAYTRSLAGASIDQGSWLEPSQVAGLNQSFRSLQPDSALGSVSGEQFEALGFSIEHRFPTMTYLTLAGDWLRSENDQTVGIFERDTSIFRQHRLSSTSARARFRERSISASISQLVGKEVALGAAYRLASTDLTESFPDAFGVIPVSFGPIYVPFTSSRHFRGLLHQLRLYARFNHSSGFFFQPEAVWSRQDMDGELGIQANREDFWQFDCMAGYRFAQRKAELALGLLNLFGQDYSLAPLTLHQELPRKRTLALRFRFSY